MTLMLSRQSAFSYLISMYILCPSDLKSEPDNLSGHFGRLGQIYSLQCYNTCDERLKTANIFIKFAVLSKFVINCFQVSKIDIIDVFTNIGH